MTVVMIKSPSERVLWNEGVAMHEADIAITKVFGTEIPGPYKLPASITQLDNEDLYLVYYGGDGEYAEGTCLWASRQKKGETAWSEPVVVAAAAFYSEGNPVVWQAPDGLVWLFYVQRYGATWSDSRIHAKSSRDGEHTWWDSFVVCQHRDDATPSSGWHGLSRWSLAIVEAPARVFHTKGHGSGLHSTYD